MDISAGIKITQYAEKINSGMRDELYRRGLEITKALREAEVEVLSGTRSGRKHRSLPNRSSAPFEAPAAQSGDLRKYWKEETIRQGNGHVAVVTSRITSDIPGNTEKEDYSVYLENGTARMAARPFAARILTKAEPKVRAISSEPYLPHIL